VANPADFKAFFASIPPVNEAGLCTMFSYYVSNPQEAASSILNQAKRRSGESGRALFESFARLSDQLIRTCMWQPPSDRRVSKCSAFKEFKHLVNMLPVDVQVPVQVRAFSAIQLVQLVGVVVGSSMCARSGIVKKP
jgi:hypothetical protein